MACSDSEETLQLGKGGDETEHAQALHDLGAKLHLAIPDELKDRVVAATTFHQPCPLEDP